MTKLTEPKALESYYKEVEQKNLQDYFTFLRFASVGAEAEYDKETRACAQWVFDYLQNIGFHCEMWPTERHPVIFASNLKAGKDKPTLLIYQHYDVQPVDPLEEWTTPPFEPTIRNGQVYARGAQDNKGQCFYTLMALKGLMDRDGQFPLNIKLCIEGEEENGSGGLASLLPKKKNELAADYLAVVDMGIQSMQSPAVTLGIRGIATMDVEVKGTTGDLHSGSHGGMAFNPIHALVELLSKLRDAKGKIAIPNFYDDVEPITDKERQALALEFDEEDYHKKFGAYPTGGEAGFSPSERAWTRPTIEINGISGGYAGKGFKTVIPAKAYAKVSCRLVPNQDPAKTAAKVATFLKANAPKGVEVSVNIHPGGGKAVRADSSSFIVKAFSQAYEEVFGKKCAYIYSGGSIPIVTDLTAVSGSQAVLLGLGLNEDQIHAPNEHFGLDRLYKGFLIMTRTIEILGQSS